MKKIIKPILLGVISTIALFGCQTKDQKQIDTKNEQTQNEETKVIPADKADSITKDTGASIESRKRLEASLDGINDFLSEKGIDYLTLDDFEDLECEESDNKEGGKTYKYKLEDGVMTLETTQEDKDGSFTFFDLRDNENKGYKLNIKTQEVISANIGDEEDNKDESTENIEETNGEEESNEEGK